MTTLTYNCEDFLLLVQNRPQLRCTLNPVSVAAHCVSLGLCGACCGGEGTPSLGQCPGTAGYVETRGDPWRSREVDPLMYHH